MMLGCNDGRAVSVTDKLLERTRSVDRLKHFIDPSQAYMTCFNSTDSEVELARRLAIPLLGNGDAAAKWGTKVGNRQVFRDAGIRHPDGSYESAWDAAALAAAVVALWRRQRSARKIIVKLNESFSGEGNAVLR